MYNEINTHKLKNSISVNPEIRYIRVIADKKYEFEGHRHICYELKAVFSGFLEATVDDTVMKLTPCEMMLVKQGAFHREITEGADYISLHLDVDGLQDFEKAMVCRLSEADRELVKLVRFYCESISKNSENASLNSKGQKIYHHCVDLNPNETRHTLVKLVEVLLYRMLAGNEAEIPINNSYAVIYNKSVNFMRDNLDKNLSVEDVAKMVGSCRTVVKNAFAKYTGHGVIKHFNYMKMIRAKALLDEGVSAAQTASVLGFSSQSYFTQSFTRECGCTPTEYKKNSNKKNMDF